MRAVVIMKTNKYSETKLKVMHDMESAFEWFRPDAKVIKENYVKFEGWLNSARLEFEHLYEHLEYLRERRGYFQYKHNVNLKDIRRELVSDCEIKSSCVHYELSRCRCGDFRYCWDTRESCHLKDFITLTYERAKVILADEISLIKDINDFIGYLSLAYEILNDYICSIKDRIYSIEGMKILEEEKAGNAIIKGYKYEDLDEFLARISEEYDRTGTITSINATKL